MIIGQRERMEVTTNGGADQADYITLLEVVLNLTKGFIALCQKCLKRINRIQIFILAKMDILRIQLPLIY